MGLLSQYRLKKMEVLRVGPGDVLILKMPDDTTQEDMVGLDAVLGRVGLAGRVVAVSGLDIGYTVVEKEAEDEPDYDRPRGSF